MFYDTQPNIQKDNYKKMLKIVGSLSNMFSESNQPYLYYRCHENIFCKYFEAENLSREDCSADAKKNNLGIGLKTWVGVDNQKVAEFNKLKDEYMSLEPLEMVKKIAFYRNTRIKTTMNKHGVKDMIYHIVKRVPNAMQILECTFDYINIDNIKLIKNKGNSTNIYFNDGKHEYHFNISKSTLYMLFDHMELLESFEVNILEDPYAFLEKLSEENKKTVEEFVSKIDSRHEQLCLRLYTINRTTKEKIVEEKSGLNQWNASGRKRNENEIYIPYPSVDRNRSIGFFPDRNIPFELILPDGKVISAKVCQGDGKAIMSNPNSELGEWLLRKVFEFPKNKIITYRDLEIYGIDSVIFTKINKKKYKIDFTYIGTYEKLLGIDEDNLED